MVWKSTSPVARIDRHGVIRRARLALHVDAERQRHVGVTQCDRVHRLVEGHAAGHAVAQHLHDGALRAAGAGSWP